jgi:hypothetical protein
VSIPSALSNKNKGSISQKVHTRKVSEDYNDLSNENKSELQSFIQNRNFHERKKSDLIQPSKSGYFNQLGPSSRNLMMDKKSNRNLLAVIDLKNMAKDRGNGVKSVDVTPM